MAIRIINITDEAIQRHVILLEEQEINLTLKFLPQVGIWTADVELDNFAAYGLKLSIGVLHMRNRNKPFDFVVRDLSNNGIDPFLRNDFSSGRCALYFLDSQDMINIRGDAVEN